MFVSEMLTRDRSMLEIDSLATEDVSAHDDRGGVSTPELIDECVPDLERDIGIGREKTGSAKTKKWISSMFYGKSSVISLTRHVHAIGTETMLFQTIA
jgi:hypothetical protein